MSPKSYITALLSVFVTIVVLCLAWEFWLLPKLLPQNEPETTEDRWEFVATGIAFSFLALIGPAVIGMGIIRRDLALRQTVIRLAQEDYLTGLYNRRRVSELLESEIRRATRYHTTFSLILADIDHFKAVNDQFGHQAGDRVLSRIADVIRSTVRETDQVGRWGGEEFVVISPETDIDGGMSLAEKIRTRLESADMGDIGHITASFGVTAFADGDDINDIEPPPTRRPLDRPTPNVKKQIPSNPMGR